MNKKIGILIVGVAGLGGLATVLMKAKSGAGDKSVELGNQSHLSAENAIVTESAKNSVEVAPVAVETKAELKEKLENNVASKQNRPNCKVVKYRQATSAIESTEHQLKLENLEVGQGFCLKQGKKVLNLASQGWVVGRIDEHKDLSLSFCKKGEDCHLPCQSKWVEKQLKKQSEDNVGDLDVEDPKMAKEMRRLAALLEEDKLERLDAQANQWHVMGEVVSCDEK